MRLGIDMQRNGEFTLTLLAEPLEHYRIEASADLAHWTTVTNLVPTNGLLPFIDPDAWKFSQRFYRAALQLSPPHISESQRLPAGPFQFLFATDIGRNYLILASSNLQAWNIATNLTDLATNTLFVDPSGANFSRRFYRVVPMP